MGLENGSLNWQISLELEGITQVNYDGDIININCKERFIINCNNGIITSPTDYYISASEDRTESNKLTVAVRNIKILQQND